jgi:hypothetical protein
MMNAALKKRGSRVLAAIASAGLISLGLGIGSNSASAAEYSCEAQSSWITDPNAPNEVPLGKQADFCEFYQFSWQWFLQLMSPAKTNDVIRQFQNTVKYPLLEADGHDSCDGVITSKTLVTSLNKVDLPERTGQAGTNGKGIYDQHGNAVLYEVRFSRNLCDAGKVQQKANFDFPTTEIKTAWKQMTASDDKSRYLIMEANIDGIPGDEILGMIGFHVAIATADHPEMIWASFEQRDNSPTCKDSKAANQEWSFASKACINDPSSCTWNNVSTVDSITGGTPNQVCTEHPYGTQIGDPNYVKNIAAITDLNSQIKGFLTELNTDPNNTMAVLQYYFNIGSLWLSDPSKSSVTSTGAPSLANQRGSLRMANTVMETSFQDGFSSTGENHQYGSNCFGCHEFKVDPNYRNTGPHNNFDVSHIFINDILKNQCKTTTSYNAGPIWSDKDAQAKCAQLCGTKGGWMGNWRTTQPGSMSECDCCNN